MNKTNLISIALLFVALLFAMPSMAQKGMGKVVKIILVRHAEKDTAKVDPELTPKGKERAERLAALAKVWKPDSLFSTTAKRAMQTLMPTTHLTGYEIRTYDTKEQATFAKSLALMSGKTILVAGHSNTIPQLANLLLGANVYCDIPDDEFGRIMIITIKDGEASVVVKGY